MFSALGKAGKVSRSRTHEIKAHPQPFQDMWAGVKASEVRQNDRHYAVGDVLLIKEYIPTVVKSPLSDSYSGRWLRRTVTHIQTGFGLPEGLVVLSCAPLYNWNDNDVWTDRGVS